MMTCAFRSVVGFRSTGLKSVCGANPHASACKACARPISPPSTVTAEFSAMFCGLNGATRTPRRCRIRHNAATSVVLPASEVVPWTIRDIQDMAGPGCKKVTIMAPSAPPESDFGRCLQVLASLRWPENREGGAIPLRAQRCKDDIRRIMPLVKIGKARRVVESESEDRPGDR